MPLLFTDAVAVDGTRVTANGYLAADAKLARTGIQIYAGSEVGRPDMETVRVYRSEDQVFSKKTMSSFAHRPITNDRPKETVDATNWKKISVGALGDQVARDGDYVRVPVVLMDADAILDFKDGQRELSCGYTCDLDWTPGRTEKGEEYDAQQVDIVGNGLAMVGRGRAGAQCHICDSSWSKPLPFPPNLSPEPSPMPNTILRNVTLDGVTFKITNEGAAAISRLQNQISSRAAQVAARDISIAAQRTEQQSELDAIQGALEVLRSTGKADLDAREGTLAALRASHAAAIDARDAEIAELKVCQPVGDALDKLVADRAAAVAAARRVLGDSYNISGKTDADLRKDTVTKVLGAAAIDGKSDEYLRAAFDTILAQVTAGGGRDPIRDAISSGARSPLAGATMEPGQHSIDEAMQARDAAKHAKNRALADAWKEPKTIH